MKCIYCYTGISPALLVSPVTLTLMASTFLARLTGSSTKYEPLPRICHISGCVGSKVVVQGGRTTDFSDKSSSVVEIFDPYSELWEQRQVEGDAPSPGTYAAASASLCDDLFSFGGFDGRQRFNTLHRLDSKTWCWSQVSPQNADGAPMPKTLCAMIGFRNSLVVLGGYGVPRGPTEPQSFIQSTTPGEGWTNELHIYNLSEGMKCNYVLPGLRNELVSKQSTLSTGATHAALSAYCT